MIFLQLPYFIKEAEDCENYIERWIYVLKNMDILNRMPWAAQHAVFQRLAKVSETSGFTPEERERYENSLKIFNDNVAIARRQRAEGHSEGYAEGKAEGEVSKAKEIAKNMKSLGIDLVTIQRATGLSEAEINAL